MVEDWLRYKVLLFDVVAAGPVALRRRKRRTIDLNMATSEAAVLRPAYI